MNGGNTDNLWREAKEPFGRGDLTE
jgi:hypothetical protein